MFKQTVNTEKNHCRTFELSFPRCILWPSLCQHLGFILIIFQLLSFPQLLISLKLARIFSCRHNSSISTPLSSSQYICFRHHSSPHGLVIRNYLQSLFFFFHPRAVVASRLASATLDNCDTLSLPRWIQTHRSARRPKRLRALGYDHPWTTEVAPLVFSLKTKSCLRPLTSKINK